MLAPASNLGFDLNFDAANMIISPQIEFMKGSLCTIENIVCDICNFFIGEDYSVVFDESKTDTSWLSDNRFYICCTCTALVLKEIVDGPFGITRPMPNEMGAIRYCEEGQHVLSLMPKQIDLFCQICLLNMTMGNIVIFRAVKVRNNIMLRHDDKFLCSLGIVANNINTPVLTGSYETAN